VSFVVFKNRSGYGGRVFRMLLDDHRASERVRMELPPLGGSEPVVSLQDLGIDVQHADVMQQGAAAKARNSAAARFRRMPR